MNLHCHLNVENQQKLGGQLIVNELFGIELRIIQMQHFSHSNENVLQSYFDIVVNTLEPIRLFYNVANQTTEQISGKEFAKSVEVQYNFQDELNQNWIDVDFHQYLKDEYEYVLSHSKCTLLNYPLEKLGYNQY